LQSIDRGEKVGGALDEGDERAHRERHAALGEIASYPIERGEERELVMDEPGEPGAGDSSARTEQAGSDTHAAMPAPARGPADDAPALMLLHDVQLLFDELVDDVECRGAARAACLRA